MGGFGSATAGRSARREVLLPAVLEAGSIDEATPLAIARRSVATNDDWADRAIYTARWKATRWLILAERVEGYTETGEPKIAFGGHRLIVVETNGAVSRYIRGR